MHENQGPQGHCCQGRWRHLAVEAFVTSSECGCLGEVQYPHGFQEVDSSLPWSWFLLPSVPGGEAHYEAWAAVLV